mmetsp:Transcript_35053/g.25512  ORF Transcript_35053/g.25512 Transcript_35053/m.25512 type:complete len:91 (+) Transcript_35053:572-844(+)
MHSMLHGKASKKDYTGTMVIGHFSKDESVGPCLYSNPDGTSYYGLRNENKNNGLGVKKYQDGSKYCGLWQEGFKKGLGIYTDDQNIVYKG